jgi:chorismate synthase
MSGNSFGNLFRITTFGESHGPALGVVVDGCPAGLKLDLAQIQMELNRRRPGQSKLVTPRNEADEFEVLSGVFEGKTTGTPLTMLVRNADAKSKDYSKIKDLFRPGHADFTYFAKYGHRDYRGGGRSSARETIGRVAAGAVAKQLLATAGITFRGGVTQVGKVKAENYNWETVEDNDVRSVDPAVVPAMIKEIETARKERDSVGGLVEVQALGVPAGLGEPVFDKLDAVIAGALMSIPAVKSVEIGVGAACAGLRGSEINDELEPEGFRSNNHGGILGGISSGAPIVAKIAIKPTSSLPQEQDTIDTSFKAQKISTLGRHDPCVALRAVPIAEAMLALVLVDYWLGQSASNAVREHFSTHTAVKYGLKNDPT